LGAQRAAQIGRSRAGADCGWAQQRQRVGRERLGDCHQIRFRQAPQRAAVFRTARKLFVAAGYRLLPITPEHGASLDELPALHADPFDRMPIAQALHEPLRLLTADGALAAYGDVVITA
jgi:hypothetical protein